MSEPKKKKIEKSAKPSVRNTTAEREGLPDSQRERERDWSLLGLVAL